LTSKSWFQDFKHLISRLQRLDFKTSILLDFKTSILLDFKTSILLDFKTSILLDFKTSILLDFKTSILLDFKTSILLNFKTSIILDFKTSRLQLFLISRLQDFNSSWFHDISSSWFQDFKDLISRLQRYDFKTSKIWFQDFNDLISRLETFILLFIVITAALANEEKTIDFTSFSPSHPVIKDPFINNELSPNVTGVLGKEVRLACHVEHLGNKTVNIIPKTINTKGPIMYRHNKCPVHLLCHHVSSSAKCLRVSKTESYALSPYFSTPTVITFGVSFELLLFLTFNVNFF
jgi:hypothetical protein